MKNLRAHTWTATCRPADRLNGGARSGLSISSYDEIVDGKAFEAGLRGRLAHV